MSDPSTTRQNLSFLPVATLRVEVVEGPDRGRVQTGDRESLSIGTAEDNDLVLTDPTVSRYHLDLERTDGGVLVVDHGSTNGVACGSVRIQRAFVPAGSTLALGSTAIRVGEGSNLAIELHPGEALAGLRGMTPVMRRLMARIDRAARSDAPVLLEGESGTGKELAARALHEIGSRSAGPFVVVDCGAMSPTLVASELFGHERGAFTGATARRLGAFERAHAGTLLLDEIGELPAALQSTLLGVLERRSFRRVGGETDVAVDARVISATHHDLRAEVNRGAFRLDLYYRIAVVVLSIPPLRDHSDDVPLLVEHFLRLCGHDGPADRVVSPGTMNVLCQHRWPGNVRELRNFVEAALAMGEASPPDVYANTAASPAASTAPPGIDGGPIAFGPLFDRTYREARRELLDQFEARYLRQLLDRTGGNVARAAREARMDRSHLIDLLGRHRLR